MNRGAPAMRRAVRREEISEEETLVRREAPAGPSVRFAGYYWNFAFFSMALFGVPGLMFSIYIISEYMPRREYRATLFEVFDYDLTWMSLPALIGAAVGLLIFFTWLGRATITVDDRGIDYKGAVRQELIPWNEIHEVDISLHPGGRGPPVPLYTIHRDGAPFKFFVDLPYGARKRFCEAVEARGVPASNSYMVFLSPLFGILTIGAPLYLVLTML